MNNKKPGAPENSNAGVNNDSLAQLAFNNAAQPNIITIVSSGKIILANKAACTLTGFSKRELLTKSRASVFDTNETGFKKMLSQRNAEGQSVALVKVIKKSGKVAFRVKSLLRFLWMKMELKKPLPPFPI